MAVLKTDYHDITDPLYSEPADIYDASDHNGENVQINTNTTAIATKLAAPIVTANIGSSQITNALMADDSVGIAELSATGTASSSTYLRGDNTWSTPAGGGGSVGATYPQTVAVTTGTETRPTGSDVVIWVGGATEPTNIDPDDVWLADESSDESTLLFAIRNEGRKIPAGRSNYRNLANTVSPSTLEDTGQAVAYATAGGAGFQIVSGRLTTSGAAGGGYRYFDAGGLLTRTGARFTFGSSGSTYGGAVAVVMMNLAFNLGNTAMRLGAHLVIDPDSWTCQKYNHATTTFTTLAEGTWPTRLAMDGITEYEAEIYHPAGNTVYLKLPDNSMVTVTDSDIGSWAGSFGYHQVTIGNATDHLAAFTETWADVGTQVIPPGSPSREQLAARGELVHTQVTTSHNLVAAAGGGAALSGLSAAVPYRGIPIMLEVFLGQVHDTVSRANIFAIVNGAGTIVQQASVLTVAGALEDIQAPILRYRIPSGTAAQTYTVRGWSATGSATATLNAGAVYPMYIRAEAV